MTDFAFPVVRVFVPLNPWSMAPYLAKRRQRQARRALALRSDQQLYCRFEKRRGSLECAFSAVGKDSPPKPLLGETIRDWLVREDVRDFLWCERLAEGFALVLVIDGRVSKDGLFADRHIDQGLKLALSQLMRSGGTPRVYAGNDAAGRHIGPALAAFESDVFETLPAPRTLDGLLAGGAATPKLTSLAATPGIKTWNRFWRLARYAASVVVLAGIGMLAYWGFQQLGQEPVAPPPTTDAAKRHYARLLATPPAGDVLLRVHAAYRDFVGDDAFAAYANVTQITWPVDQSRTRGARDAVAALQIMARLTVVDGDWEDKRQASAFPAQLAEYATTRGWMGFAMVPSEPRRSQRRAAPGVIEPQGAAFTLAAPLTRYPPKRTVPQATALQQPPPRSDDGSPSPTNGLDESLSVLGTVQVVSSLHREVFEMTEVQLVMPNTHWLDRDIVEWLATRLNDGPVVLDSVELQTIAGGGADDITTLRFRLAWCVAGRDSSTCIEPLTAADFAQPQPGAPQT